MKHQQTMAGPGLFAPRLVRAALGDAVRKLSPRTQWANPVMFVVYLGAVLTTLLWLQGLAQADNPRQGLTLAIACWLWFTVLFANFAEALAEGRSRAQAASLRGMKRDTVAKLLQQPHHGAAWTPLRASELRQGMVLLVEAGDVIALDGTVVQGGVGGRKRHHRRIGPGDPRGGRGFLLGHGGHARVVRLAGG